MNKAQRVSSSFVQRPQPALKSKEAIIDRAQFRNIEWMDEQSVFQGVIRGRFCNFG
jgi:hypothetical protein